MTDLITYELAIAIIFLAAIFMHLAKRNTSTVALYAVQSLGVVLLLLRSYFDSPSQALLVILILTLALKVIMAPYFFNTLIKKNQLTFSVNTYLSLPLTLISIGILTAFTESQIFAPLASLDPANGTLITFALAVIFISLFLIINRKGALSQLIGVLSLENAIVAFAIFAGLEQSFALQLGMLFDIVVWLVVAGALVALIFKHFGTLDVPSMNNLKD